MRGSKLREHFESLAHGVPWYTPLNGTVLSDRLPQEPDGKAKGSVVEKRTGEIASSRVPNSLGSGDSKKILIRNSRASQIHHTPHTRRHRPMLKIPPLQRLAPLGAILQHDPSSTGNARRATHSTGEPGRPVWHAASSPCSLSSSSCVVRSSASKEVIESQLESSASSSCSSHSPPKP